MKNHLKITTLLLAVFTAFAAMAQSTATPLPMVDPDRVLVTQGPRPHVLFVNVAAAEKEPLLRDAVAAVSLVMPVNLALKELAALPPAADLYGRKALNVGSPSTKLTVFVCRDPSLASFLAAPGRWAMVNLHGLDRNTPEAELYRRRLRQMMLKGLGLAAGVGGNGDSRCVMYYKSFTLSGIDQTSVSYSPFAGSPLQSLLVDIGSEAIFAVPEEPVP